MGDVPERVCSGGVECVLYLNRMHPDPVLFSSRGVRVFVCLGSRRPLGVSPDRRERSSPRVPRPGEELPYSPAAVARGGSWPRYPLAAEDGTPVLPERDTAVDVTPPKRVIQAAKAQNRPDSGCRGRLPWRAWVSSRHPVPGSSNRSTNK